MLNVFSCCLINVTNVCFDHSLGLCVEMQILAELLILANFTMNFTNELANFTFCLEG